MGPYNVRSAFFLELWVQEITFAQWRKSLPREKRREILRSWTESWFNPELAPLSIKSEK